MESQTRSETTTIQQVVEPQQISQNENEEKKEKKKTKRRNRRFFPRIGCLRLEQDSDTPYGGFSVEMECDSHGDVCVPTHLVVMVNGLIGSASDWRFSAKQFLKRYPRDVVVHCSERNSAMMTFDGVDIMGERLTEEVISVIKRRPGLQKISFVGHSMGGLVARYAIGRLYRQNIMREASKENGSSGTVGPDKPSMDEKSKNNIAGLEPMNFITIATPHLGSRGHKQVPGFGSLHIVEKAAHNISWIFGRTGKHLMLTDKDDGKLPLLLQMVNDCGDLPFMSALQSFRRRVAYANGQCGTQCVGALIFLKSLHGCTATRFNLYLRNVTYLWTLTNFKVLVGWRTSSIRRQDELPKRRHLLKNDRYPHVVNVEAPKADGSDHEVILEPEMKRLRTRDLEELMIRGLTKVSWERVDVSFRRSKQAIFAHSTIQVKSYCMNSDGADVIFHLIDNFLL